MSGAAPIAESAARWRLEDRIEKAKPSDPALDYCLWPYERPQPPAPGALRTASLLYQAAHVAGAPEKLLDAFGALRNRLGRFAVVFGVKWAGERLSFEFYFYDYARWQRRYGIADIAEALAPHVRWSAPIDDAKPYFMVSVEVDARHGRGDAEIDQVDVYVGTPDAGVSAGICFGLSRAGYEMRNLYYFYDAATARDDAIAKAAATVRFDARAAKLSALFWPEMDGVQTIVVANKRFADGLYYSRIKVDQLLLFLRRAAFPSEIIAYIETHRAAFAHHLFDVGFDYELTPDGGLKILKGSYYGLL